MPNPDGYISKAKIHKEMEEAEEKAFKALAKYKFQMFGYWAAIWVHLNKLGNFSESNPFSEYVKKARTHVAIVEAYFK
jgi:hypothetical protein